MVSISPEKTEHALLLWKKAWNQLVSGALFDSNVNDQVEQLTKALWLTQCKNRVKHHIIQDLPRIFPSFAAQHNPPPILLTLISLKDNELNILIQEEALLEWIKNKASEPTTFQLINLIDTFERYGAHNRYFIESIIKYMSEDMDQEMLKALGFMLVNGNDQYLMMLLKKFAGFTGKDLLKDFVEMVGRKAILTLMQFIRPGDVKRLLS